MGGDAVETVHLSSYLTASVAQHGERRAVVGVDGHSLTYRQLDDHARRIARFLRDRGVTPGERVGLVMTKSPEAVAAIAGILAAGAAYVPADPSAPPERCRKIMTDCQARVLFVDAGGAAVLADWPDGERPLGIAVGDGCEVRDGVALADVLATEPLPVAAVGGEPGDLAYILYTSGSTGVPKGVMLSHANATSFIGWCSATFTLGAEDQFSSHAPFHFDLSVFDLYACLKHGGTLHLIPDALAKNPKQLARFAAERAITVWYSTPSVLSLLAQFGRLDRLDWPGPRLVLFAGEVFPVRHLRAVTELWTDSEWFNLYGPTETNVCTYAPIPGSIPADREEPYPIGRVCSHCRGVVLDAAGERVGAGGEGSLLITGAPVFSGYWNRPEENARVFHELDGERYYDTGDLVRVGPDDELTYVGRKDRMVKRRGYRIELGEIESALYRHPAIRDAAAVAVSHDAGVDIVVAVVAAAEMPSIIELKSFCSRELPSYMVPDRFQALDELPRTSTDKLDYQTLSRRLTAVDG